MGIFARLLGSETSGGQRGSTGGRPQALFGSDGFDDPALAAFIGGGGTRTGRHVNETSALKNATLFRAANLISGVVGMLPTNLLRRNPDGTIEKALDHPAQRLMRVSPNPARRQTPSQWKSYMQGRALLRGNAFAYKVPGVRGPQGLVALDPARVTIKERSDGALEYIWQPSNGAKRTFSQDDVLHIRAPWSSDGVSGDGLLKLAAEALSLADAGDEAAAKMLKNGTYVGGILKHPKQLGVEAAKRLKEQFAAYHSGPDNAGKWMVAEEGLEVQQLGVTGRDAQGIEQRKLQIEEIARYTGLPRPLLMMDDTSWGSGIEQLGLYFVIYCLMPWFVSWEEALNLSLLTEEERKTHYFKFNEAALLRGSLKDQAEFLAKALGGPGATGYMVPNEARDKMELPPIDGGDLPNWGQMDNGEADATA